MRMRIIAHQFEIFVFEIQYVLHLRVYLHLWQRAWVTGQLQLHLVQMVQVDMCIAQGVDKITCLQAGHLCHHLEQQGIRGDVERHA